MDIFVLWISSKGGFNVLIVIMCHVFEPVYYYYYYFMYLFKVLVAVICKLSNRCTAAIQSRDDKQRAQAFFFI